MTARSVCVVDDDDQVRNAIVSLLSAEGYTVHAFADGHALLSDLYRISFGPIITDVQMPGLDGLELIGRLKAAGHGDRPVIVITAYADVPLVVEAMRAGARDFIEKPFEPDVFLAAVASVFASAGADAVVSRLTPRERQVAEAIVRGLTSKQIAIELEISHRTVEVFRARLLRKTGAANTAALAALMSGR